MTHVLSGILGYLIGSIPTAFLLVRWKSGIDIRSAGSGNVGALNSFQVTKSRLAGAGVLVIDLAKGALAVGLASAVFGSEFYIQATSGVVAVFGHNFSLWLGFSGGRGLATATGVMLVLAWPVVPIWMVLWVLAFAIARNVNVGNAIASAVVMMGLLVLPASLLTMLIGLTISPTEFRVFGFILFVLILIKHIEPVREYLIGLKGSATH